MVAGGSVGAAAGAQIDRAYEVSAGLGNTAFVSQGNSSGISESEQALLDGAKDGYLTLGEANAHYRHGNGEPIDVDASKLRVHTRNGINGTVQGNDYFVHGQVTLNPETGRIYDGAYDFEIHTLSGPLDVPTYMRNVATRIGRWRAGEGTPFTIRYRGQPTIVRPAPHNRRRR